MLKIKDNVDLKELEKFGLKPRYIMIDEKTGETSIESYHSSKYQPRFGYCTFIKKKGNAILNIVNRLIRNRVDRKTFVFEDDNYVDVDLLYDLIKADLVVKVEE